MRVNCDATDTIYFSFTVWNCQITRSITTHASFKITILHTKTAARTQRTTQYTSFCLFVLNLSNLTVKCYKNLSIIPCTLRGPVFSKPKVNFYILNNESISTCFTKCVSSSNISHNIFL
jgi:hypothetical protein